jgi:hypothetical protein
VAVGSSVGSAAVPPFSADDETFMALFDFAEAYAFPGTATAAGNQHDQDDDDDDEDDGREPEARCTLA